jgi:pimeloyl-ACP methyl ester carboxylesterase
MKRDTLPVPGAALYYKVRGSGPVLLMIPGGPMDAGGLAAIAERLADESTPDQMTYQASYALAEKLGSRPVPFPGGHGGFDSHPDGFAAGLREVLAETSESQPGFTQQME